MNYSRQFSSSLLNLLRKSGNIFNIQEILLVPLKPQQKDIITLFSQLSEETNKVKSDKNKIIKQLQKQHFSEKYDSNDVIINIESYNEDTPLLFANKIQTKDAVFVLAYFRENDSLQGWTQQERSILRLLSKLVQADLSNESNSSHQDKARTVNQSDQYIYKIIQLQYILPMANSLQILKKAVKIVDTMLNSEDLEEITTLQNCLNRITNVLTYNKEVVDDIQDSFWSPNNEAAESTVEKVNIESFFSTYCDQNNNAEANILYGHIKAPFTFPHNDIYIRTTVLEKFLGAVVNNAIKFAKNGEAEIYITTELDKLDLTVSVRDMGIGIPSGELDYIADPFFRASNNKSETGIGFELAIIKRIIEEYGGFIKFQSVENVYTEVICKLPYHIDNPLDKN